MEEQLGTNKLLSIIKWTEHASYNLIDWLKMMNHLAIDGESKTSSHQFFLLMLSLNYLGSYGNEASFHKIGQDMGIFIGGYELVCDTDM